MHGYLRLLLSLVVVLSHLGLEGKGVHFGIASVAVFYMLSGYVVTNLCLKFFPPGRLGQFYMERFLRIYPLYIVLLLLFAAFFFATGFKSPKLSAWSAVGNLTIVPLAYSKYIQFPILTDGNAPLLLTAWSLGVEIQAYLLLPLILRSEIAKWALGVASLTVSVLASFGVLDPDLWGYRLLAGVMFIFLAGCGLYRALHARADRTRFDVWFPWIGWLVVLLSVLIVGLHALHETSVSVALGYLCGLPLLRLTSSKRKVPGAALAGQLSYGVFLAHAPLIWIYEYLFDSDIHSVRCVFFVVATSLWVALLATLTVEKFIWPWRVRFTGTASSKQTPLCSDKNPARWLMGVCAVVLSIVAGIGVAQTRLGYPFGRTVPIASKDVHAIGNGVYAVSAPLKTNSAPAVHHRSHLRENGEANMPWAHSSERVRNSSNGAFAMSSRQIWFRPPDGSDPRANGPSYAVVFPLVLPTWVEILCWLVLGAALPVWVILFSRWGQSAKPCCQGATSST